VNDLPARLPSIAMTNSKSSISTSDQRTIQEAGVVLAGKSRKGFFRRMLPFFGPAFIASIAYVDRAILRQILQAEQNTATCSCG